MWDLIKDNMNSFLGIALLILPFFFIPEIRKSRKYKIFFVFAFVILSWLGCDKIKRDRKSKSNYELDKSNNETKLGKVESILNTMAANYKSDTAKFSEFKNKLEANFHIRDSANSPVQIKNYITNIKKADKVNIGDH
jgi:hypothetical protein